MSVLLCTGTICGHVYNTTSYHFAEKTSCRALFELC